MGERSSASGAVRSLSQYPPSVWLWDFDVDSANLKQAHLAYLSSLVILIRSKAPKPGSRGKWIISVTGRTSGTGSEAHNEGLSRRRAEAVATYLRNSLKDIPMEVNVGWVGEKGARNNVEDPWPRAVAIMAMEPIEGTKKTDPKPVRAPEVSVENLFAVRITYFSRYGLGVGRDVGGSSLKAGLKAGATRMAIGLQILDLAKREVASYRLTPVLVVGSAEVSLPTRSLDGPDSIDIPTPWGVSISVSGQKWRGKGHWIPFQDDRLDSVESLKTWWARVTKVRSGSLDLLLSPSAVVLEGFWHPEVIKIRKLEIPESGPLSVEFFADPALLGVPLVLTKEAEPWVGPTPLDELVQKVREVAAHVKTLQAVHRINRGARKGADTAAAAAKAAEVVAAINAASITAAANAAARR